MNCPRGHSAKTHESAHKTALGSCTFRCSDCKARFNERSGTPFNNRQFPSAIGLLVVPWRLRYKLRLRGLAAMFLERGFQFIHEAVCNWETRFAPLIAEQLRAKRKGKAGSGWYVGETYLRIGGKSHYLYRAIDRDGNLVDSMLSKTRDLDAAKRFFKGAREITGCTPTRVTSEKHPAYPRAIRRVGGRPVKQRQSRYLNNWLEQNPRGVKQRYYLMRGFGNFEAAARFCRAYDEQRNYFRYRNKLNAKVSLAEQCRLFRRRLAGLQQELIAA
jgi:transposase-like protein